jgi:signal transduction histidine kinase
VNADPGLMQVVVQNLLRNAWKFTGRSDHARIEFGCSQQGNVTVFYVRDNGAGFDQRFAEKLFKPFQRLHATSDFPGTGIGLATVEKIIRRHGGEVWAEGEVEKGATFSFTLEPRKT